MREELVMGSPVGHSSDHSSRKNLPCVASRMSSPKLGSGTATPVCLALFLVLGLFTIMFSLVLQPSRLLVPVDISQAEILSLSYFYDRVVWMGNSS